MQTLTFLFAFIAVLALIGVAAWLVRRFANNRLGANTQRGRMPRLAVIDAAAVDGRRRLVLVRRDNVEHLLMIGGPSDIVVEPNIVRAMPNRDQMAPRPAVGEQPPRIAPLPDAAWNDEAAREAARSDSRSTDAFDHPEPQMPEPPPRPARPAFADEIRAAEGYAHGAVDFITAPVVPPILRAKVKVFVDLFRMTEQIKQHAEERITHAQERSKREAAEDANRRLSFLARAGAVITKSLDRAVTVESILRLLVPEHADQAARRRRI